jgi:hypothetical protein
MPHVCDIATWMPHGYDPDVWEPRTAPRSPEMHLRAPGPRAAKRFYWMGAPTARKNPFGVLRAFCAAFAPGAGTPPPAMPVALVFHMPMSRGDWGQFLAMSGAPIDWLMSHVFLSAEVLSDAEMPRFHLEHDVFVSTSRGEAWNLPAFEAATIGNWVIAPRGQGSDAYLTPQNSSRTEALGLEPAWYDATLDELTDVNGRARATVTVTGLQGLDPCVHHWQVPDIIGTAALMQDVARLTQAASWKPLPLTPFAYPSIAARARAILHATLDRTKKP